MIKGTSLLQKINKYTVVIASEPAGERGNLVLSNSKLRVEDLQAHHLYVSEAR
jgi:hypothetical protein